MPVLRALKGMNPGQLITVKEEINVLGRHPNCDIVLEVGAVSRQHARLVQEGDKFFIEDLGSTNGTYLNDERVDGREPIGENDQLKICDLVFVFHIGAPDSDQSFGESTGTRVMMVDDERDDNSAVMSKLDVSSGKDGLRLAVNAEAKLKAVLEIGQNLGKAIGLVEVLPKVLDSLFSIFLQADRGFIVLKDPRTGKVLPRAVKHRREDEAEQSRISRTIVSEVMDSKQAMLSADASTDSRFDMAASIADIHIHSMMCAPLVGSDGDALGILQIDTRDPRHQFTDSDLDVLASVACQAAIAVENAQLHETAVQEEVTQHELEVAHKVQRGFLPAEPPKVEGYEFFDYYEPARQLGGDYFDYIPLPDGRLAVVLGDVSGKGVAAALFMARLSSEARFRLLSEPDLTKAITLLNETFCQSAWDERFVTFMLTVLDPTTHEVTVVNGGHMPPLWRRQSGEIIPLDIDTGMPLGVYDEAEFEASSITLAPGESLTLYSDGIPDAMNEAEEFYTEERFFVQLARPELDGVEALGKWILGDVERFAGARRQTDDMCLTLFGRVRDS